MSKRSAAQKIKQLIKLSCLGSITFSGICIFQGNERFYSSFLMPFLQNSIVKDAEKAHRLAIWAAKNDLLIAPPSVRKEIKMKQENPMLVTKVFGIKFPNPVGIAAGFDKNAEAVEGMHNLGFGFVEIGSVTPKPQPGNPMPRVFRLNEDQAIINRYGFNSDGHEVVFQRLETLQSKYSDMGSTKRKPIIGINLGKNKTSPVDSVQDYVDGVYKFGGIADYLVINISSPNTSVLRSLQERDQMKHLIKEVIKARNSLQLPKDSKKPPVVIKIAPDLTKEDRVDIAGVIMSSDYEIDGLIVSNTTISRPSSLNSELKSETGGLSGQPLKELSTQAIYDMYKLTKGKVPIIGVGGVGSGQDAFDKIAAGASLVQLYTSFVYIGPPVAAKINRELENILQDKGFSNLKQAIGSAHT